MFPVQAKVIRLRNETINPAPPAVAKASPAPLQPAAAEPPVSGLYIIQFTDRLQPGWREELRGLGVELLHYVPEDAFVARVNQVPLSRLRALGFVTWTGEYRPEHKVHQGLRNRLGNLKAGELVPVGILLAPNAAPAEVGAARRLFQAIGRESHLRFGSIVRGRVSPANLEALARSPAVLWIEAAPQFKLLDETASKIVGGDGAQHATLVQLAGFDGRGVTVSVADTGLNNGDAGTMHPDLAGRVTAFLYYGTLTNAADEHSHGTHVAGIVAGDGATGESDEFGAWYGLGVAPRANIVVQRIFDGVGNFEAPPSNETLTRDALHAGADIGSNSWGDDTQGRYDLSAAEFDALVRDADALTAGDQPYILEFSAGNAGPGPQTIGSPAVGKNVIATGASQNNRFDMLIYEEGQESMADFSSRGPCEDGRIKPDLVAPGTWIASLKSASATDENAWSPISDNYMYQGGTSQAGPHASGAAAVFVQYYRETFGATPSPALVKAALINSAVDMDDSVETEPVPNMDEGWGRLDLSELIGSQGIHDFVDQTERLTTGQVFERSFMVASGELPLKFTLVYTDVPGLPAAVPALVNDLDLEIVGPDGTVYHGNQFTAGESVPSPTQYDRINNVEAVHLAEPMPGQYLVRIRAHNVVQDALQATPAIDQDFALVSSGDLLAPSMSLLVFDRRAYTSPSQINLKLYDFDLAGQSAVSVLVTSGTEPAGEPMVLRAVGAAGVFTNSIATVTLPAPADGKLSITHHDTITATYQDASPAGTRTAVAVADLVPPVISGVLAKSRFGRTIVAWNTDEPASSVVRYGIDQNRTLTLASSSFDQLHELALTNLTPEVIYTFEVISIDVAGNAATNNNGGAGFSFVPAPAAPILLVDSYTDLLFAVPPLTGYTEALDQTGIGYEIWDATQGDSPTLSDLRPFRLVIWRQQEYWGTFFPAEIAALTNYLNGGGALLMASMELGSRLDEAGYSAFRSNVLHLASFSADDGVSDIVGTINDPMTSGTEITLDYSPYADWFKELMGMPADVSDTITPGPGAAPIFFDAFSGDCAGLRYPQMGVDAPGRVVYLSFPLDAVPMTGAPPNNRSYLLLNLISFLVPGVNGMGTVALDRPAYNLPAVITIEVADSDLAALDQTTVTISSTTDAAGLPVILYATAQRGVFRGSISLVSDSAPPAAGQLRAKTGDTIRVAYFDASLNQTKQITAVVDTTPAEIAEVEAIPDYTDAYIYWATSEPADALVQYGTSRLLGRAASSATLTDFHELKLSGLDPDRLYYYQIISRDAAGNAAIDDNQGQLYTFQTLRPLSPPWSDSISAPGDGWTVYTGDYSEGGWRLGMPNNGKETAAHSPPGAWGTSLDGETLSTVETYLISPPVHLAGSNQIILRFWHSFDFFVYSEYDLYEEGIVSVMTTDGAEMVAIGSFEMDDYTEGWEQVEMDLTPYAGRVVYLVWQYELLSFDFENSYGRMGWLVDDVEVAFKPLEPGTIQITNNLAQARFTLSGPTSHTGQGAGLLLTEAPPGRYVLAFDEVAYYQTPPPQTNTLNSGGTLLFQGLYTFPDTNANGMSDLWEQQFFGSVSTNRTALTDSDGDGFSDYAEFTAGTHPASAASKLGLVAPAVLANGNLRLQWSSVSGRDYRILGGTDLKTWSPVTEWIPATGPNTGYELPLPSTGTASMFRLEVRP